MTSKCAALSAKMSDGIEIALLMEDLHMAFR